MDHALREPERPTAARLSGRLRIVLAVGGLVLLVPLGLAAALTPSPRGLGTHQQLGLPPCSLKFLFDMRCPSCGMTTAWSHALRGQWPSAFRANAGGALLAAWALLAAPWMLASAARGRWIVRPPAEWMVAAAALVVVGVTLVDWYVRLRAGS